MQSLIVTMCGMLFILLAMGFTPKFTVISFILVGVVLFGVTLALFIAALIGAVQLYDYIRTRNNDKH